MVFTPITGKRWATQKLRHVHGFVLEKAMTDKSQMTDKSKV